MRTVEESSHRPEERDICPPGRLIYFLSWDPRLMPSAGTEFILWPGATERRRHQEDWR